MTQQDFFWPRNFQLANHLYNVVGYGHHLHVIATTTRNTGSPVRQAELPYSSRLTRGGSPALISWRAGSHSLPSAGRRTRTTKIKRGAKGRVTGRCPMGPLGSA